MKHFPLLLAVTMMCVSCCALRTHKASFANTRWTSTFEEFVADIGTETVTFTLSFGAEKDFTLEEKSFLPAHPATYMNPDGTVDTLPAISREYTLRGTYTQKGTDLLLTTEDGTLHTLQILPDRLVSDDLSYQKLLFEKAAPEN